MIEKITGIRKLGYALILTTISVIAMFTGYTDFDTFAEFNKWLYVAYAGTNVGEYFGKRFGTKKTEKQTP